MLMRVSVRACAHVCVHVWRVCVCVCVNEGCSPAHVCLLACVRVSVHVSGWLASGCVDVRARARARACARTRRTVGSSRIEKHIKFSLDKLCAALGSEQ